MLTILGSLAEFERELIRVRTGEGRARAKARGQSLGRPHKLTVHQRHEAIARRAQGEESLSEIECQRGDDFEAIGMTALRARSRSTLIWGNGMGAHDNPRARSDLCESRGIPLG